MIILPYHTCYVNVRLLNCEVLTPTTSTVGVYSTVYSTTGTVRLVLPDGLVVLVVLGVCSCTVLVYQKRQIPRYRRVPVLYSKNYVNFVPTVKLNIDYLVL